MTDKNKQNHFYECVLYVYVIVLDSQAVTVIYVGALYDLFLK